MLPANRVTLEPSLTTDDKPIQSSAREQVQPRPRPEGVLPFAMKEEKMRAGRTTRDDRSEEVAALIRRESLGEGDRGQAELINICGMVK